MRPGIDPVFGMCGRWGRVPPSAQDLTTYLDAGTLIELRPELYLPRGVRQAWEELHPVLRAAAIPA